MSTVCRTLVVGALEVFVLQRRQHMTIAWAILLCPVTDLLVIGTVREEVGFAELEEVGSD